MTGVTSSGQRGEVIVASGVFCLRHTIGDRVVIAVVAGDASAGSHVLAREVLEGRWLLEIETSRRMQVTGIARERTRRDMRGSLAVRLAYRLSAVMATVAGAGHDTSVVVPRRFPGGGNVAGTTLQRRGDMTCLFGGGRNAVVAGGTRGHDTGVVVPCR